MKPSIPDEEPSVVDWDRIVRDASEFLVAEHGWMRETAERAIRDALNSPPPIPFLGISLR